MRPLNKTVLILSAVAIIISVTVYATVAFLTDTETVTNTFSIGKVDIFLDETKIEPESGEAVIDPSSGLPLRTDDGNQYHMLPGKTYIKDPTVTVDPDSESAYIRMVVSINKMDVLRRFFGETFLPENYVSGWDPAVWPCVGMNPSSAASNTMVYEFRYFQTVDVETTCSLPPLFESFTVPGELTGEQLAELADLQVIVQAHAIQVEGFHGDENAAWLAFSGQVKGADVILPAAQLPVP